MHIIKYGIFLLITLSVTFIFIFSFNEIHETETNAIIDLYSPKKIFKKTRDYKDVHSPPTNKILYLY